MADSWKIGESAVKQKFHETSVQLSPKLNKFETDEERKMKLFQPEPRLKDFQRIDVDAIRMAMKKEVEAEQLKTVQLFDINRIKWMIYNNLPLWLVSRWHLHNVGS